MKNKKVILGVSSAIIIVAVLFILGSGDSVDLTGNRVAVMIADGYVHVETKSTIDYLQKRGADVVVIGPETGEVKASDPDNQSYNIELAIGAISAADFDALVIPGGGSPEVLIRTQGTFDLVRSFVEKEITTAAICAGPKVLVAANCVTGRTLTSFWKVRELFEEHGVSWVDKPVAIDGYVITSRGPDDLPAFNRALGEMLVSKNQ